MNGICVRAWTTPLWMGSGVVDRRRNGMSRNGMNRRGCHATLGRPRGIPDVPRHTLGRAADAPPAHHQG